MFYPEHAEMIQNYRYEIQRCDAVRYLILHRYGGWYADMDYYCNKPLDEAMLTYTNSVYLVQTPNSVIGSNDDYISNSLMYSIPKHPFWNEVMVDLQKNQTLPLYYSRHLTIMFSTGPAILNQTYSRCKSRYKIKSLPWKLFHPYGIKDNKLTLKNNLEAYAIHIGKGSWEENDSKFLIFWLREWKLLAFVIGTFLFLFLYVIFQQRK